MGGLVYLYEHIGKRIIVCNRTPISQTTSDMLLVKLLCSSKSCAYFIINLTGVISCMVIMRMCRALRTHELLVCDFMCSRVEARSANHIEQLVAIGLRVN